MASNWSRVRFRYDEQRRKRGATIEIIVEESGRQHRGNIMLKQLTALLIFSLSLLILNQGRARSKTAEVVWAA